ncbi:hypothetical protein ACTU6U_07340 [Microbacterium sp. A196]|uniref:hypothetical protein n=1 Tax=unclassified Microbacterium TaxID=2609290 RepID=UPI003FD094DE
MSIQQSRRRRKALQILGLVAIALLFVVALWIDLTTQVWQQAVILAGIAAGLLTFLLTALFFEQWMARSAHKRWFPVTHLALTDLLHALSDEERSEFSRGQIAARSIKNAGDHDSALVAIHHERRAITHALARWAGFLAASADVQELMDHIAELALLLDEARDAVLDAESAPTSAPAQDAMRAAIASADASIQAAVDSIQATLGAFTAQRAAALQP